MSTDSIRATLHQLPGQVDEETAEEILEFVEWLQAQQAAPREPAGQRSR